MEVGDKVGPDEYITLILSREEMAKFSNDMFDNPLNPKVIDDDFWKYVAQQVGSALWSNLYAEMYPEDYTFRPEEE